MSDISLDRLVPKPHRIERQPGTLCLRSPLRIRQSGTTDARAAAFLAGRLAALGVECEAVADGEAGIHLIRGARADTGPQGYCLRIDSQGVHVDATDDAGLFYAAATLAQIAQLSAHARPGQALELPASTVTDQPDFRNRGVMLDVSRDRVLTMETLESLVDQFASLKFNQLQLYFEHTFAYTGHESVWSESSPLTAAEIRQLDAYCRERFIDLVPNQQSFGHMHRWLVQDRYRDLAECPEGLEHAFSLKPEPFSFDPTQPAVLKLLAELYDELLPNFQSKLFHVGLDETIDLGMGRSRAACEERGKGRVYLDYLCDVHRLVGERGRRMMFWGDIIVEHPELVPKLPQDAIATEWGYEAGHPFEEHARQFADSGLEFYVCPGTSSWQSFLGRIPNATANLSEAAQAGIAAGASGYLVTDWGDFGHWQPMPVSWPGFLVGAARAWNASAEPGPLAELLNLHVFKDRSGTAGRVLVALGEVYQEIGARTVNGSAPFFFLRNAHKGFPHERVQDLTQAGLDRCTASVASLLADLDGHAMQIPDADLIVRELRWAGEATRVACSLGSARLAAAPDTPLAALDTRTQLAAELMQVATGLREIWPGRSRPGGLRESAARFERIADMCRGE